MTTTARATAGGPYVLALDEGSTSARAVLVDQLGRIVAESRNPVVPNRPRRGWVELDPVALWQAQHSAVERVLAKVGATSDDVAAVGITTHRETIAVWDRATGEPVHDAIMWMSHQTDDIVARWRAAGLEPDARRRTGVPIDSFFSAAKLAWLLEEVPGVRARAERGELAAGTVDSWLLWNLTGGRSHLTDHGEASRTALFNLHALDWDETLCEAYGIPMSLLPPAVASDAEFGHVAPGLLGGGNREVPVRAILADQQAGMFGQACFRRGSAKNTYGTASVLTVNSGGDVLDVEGMTSSAAWTVAGQTTFESEGVVFHSGQTLSWLREDLKVLPAGGNIEEIARSAGDDHGLYLVPAFTGLCAPHWEHDATGAIVGLGLETRPEHLVRAGVESMAYQVRDVVEGYARAGMPLPELRVDGGAAGNDLLCQFQADICGIPVVRPDELERTALGVAYLAGAGVGMWNVPTDVEAGWKVERVFEPEMSADRREELCAGWDDAVAGVCEAGARRRDRLARKASVPS
ncbi:FGGY family carbohydrate kinase [Kineococcus gynurae]|uniref:ATP:glycerol 3-phosphotransferase n=1 Tax=Kineococcus gynurae TaxID=452979 RepID=A0ABV5LP88_9ACTN